MSVSTAPARSRPRVVFDKLGVPLVLIGAAGAVADFAVFRANRIVPGDGRTILEALPGPEGAALATIVGAALVVALLRSPALVRLLISVAALTALLIFIGRAAAWLSPEGDRLARVSPGAGFWLMFFALALIAVDGLTRLKPGPIPRVGALILAAGGVAMLLAGGAWADLSIVREYAVRAGAFWNEAGQHVRLAFGSLAAAAVAGIPLGIICHRAPRLRAVVLGILNVVQTIPSIALFGLLIAPLAWVAATVPFAAELGVSGIGAAPAFVALFGYSLLPMVANTVVGLEGVPPAAGDAARGMGMTAAQRLWSVQFPLALPVILTGVRIVLVQNIGLATVAALIGGGGLGVFVFQGIGQAAMDLVLLGAIPTIALAFASAVALDALVELLDRRRRG